MSLLAHRLVLAVLPWLPGVLLAQAEGPGGIAAIVGDEVITYGELDRRVDAFIAERVADRPVEPAYIEHVRPMLRWKILEGMVEQSLMLQEAGRLKYSVSEPQIDERVNSQIDMLREKGEKIRNAEDFYEILLQNEKMTREEFREELRKKMLVELLLWKDVWLNERINPGELRQYYRSHPRQFQAPSEVTFRMIIVPLDEDTNKKIEAIEEGLDQEVPFAELARRFSDLKADDGGLWRRQFDELQDWQPPIPDILRRMEPGDIERKILTSTGWAYLKMESIQIGEARSFEDAQEEIKSEILVRRRVDDRKKFVDRLRKRSFVEIRLPPPPKLGEKSAAVQATTTTDTDEEENSPPKVQDASNQKKKK